MEIVLVRHTRPAVATGTCYGRLDLGLADGWNQEIAATLASVGRVDAIVSSPAQRCMQLAQALAARDSCTVTSAPELQELDFGRWEGMLWSDIPRPQSDCWAADTWYQAPPGGETEKALWDRVQAWYEDSFSNRSSRIAIIAHAGSLRILRCLILGLPREQRWSWQIPYGAALQLTVPLV